jgi:hypothetical protein
VNFAVVEYNDRVLIVADWIIWVHLSSQIVDKLSKSLSVKTSVDNFDM